MNRRYFLTTFALAGAQIATKGLPSANDTVRSPCPLREAPRTRQEGVAGEVARGRRLGSSGRDALGRERKAPVAAGVECVLGLGPGPPRAVSRERLHIG